MIVDEALEALEQIGLVEPSHKMIFAGYRLREGGLPQHVTIDLAVSGVNEKRRYRATVTTESGNTVSGNAEADVRLALAGVHWFDLD